MTSLPTLVRAQRPDRSVLEARGGFAWWYADLVDERGDGAVVIFGWGLPFLPGYASAARAGRAPRAVERPAISVSTFSNGRLSFWTLTELPAEGVTWEGDCVTTSAGTLSVTPGAAFSLSASLSGALRGEPWALTLEISGVGREPGTDEPAHAPHEWHVLCAAGHGELTLTAGGVERSWSGRAYVDRNASEAPLERVSGPWHWGRLALPGRDRVWYAAEAGRTLSIDQRARVEPPPVVDVWRAGRWGQWIPAVVAWPDGSVELKPVDDSPFYVRFLAKGRIDGEPAAGIAEYCVPGRLDQAWMRSLVRMAVVPADQRASRWLPLLAGAAEGRVQRTLRSWLR